MYDKRRISDRDRFEEVYSDDDEEEEEENSRSGVLAALGPKNRSISDKFYSTDARSRYPVPQSRSYEDLAYGDNYVSSGPEGDDDYDHEPRRPPSRQIMLRSQELLAEQALSRIQRAKAKGKSVTLSHEELEALESRRGSVSDSHDHKRTSPTKGSPAPGTATGAWTRRRSKSKPPTPSSSVAPPKYRPPKDPRSARKPSPDHPAYTTGSIAAPPPFMLPGPGGIPFYSPLAYYDTQPPPPRPSHPNPDHEPEDHLPFTRRSLPPNTLPNAHRHRDAPGARRPHDAPLPFPSPWAGYGPDYLRNGYHGPVYASDTAAAGVGVYGSGRRVVSGPVGGGRSGSGARMARAPGWEAMSRSESSLRDVGRGYGGRSEGEGSGEEGSGDEEAEMEGSEDDALAEEVYGRRVRGTEGMRTRR